MVLRVPRAALLTSESAFMRDHRLASCVRRHPHLSPTQVLVVCLLAEVHKARASWWYPYLKQLPLSYNILATFTKFEIQALQVEDAIWIADTAVSKAEVEWKQAFLLMQEIELKPQLLSFKAWLWASATVMSRALHIPWDCAGCLCPVGDLFNYAAPSGEDTEGEVSFSDGISRLDQYDNDIMVDHYDTSLRLTDGGYEEHLDSYCFYARQGYIKGEQVFLGYGTYTNLELLEYYGFLLNRNPNDKSFISLEAPIQASDWPKDSLFIQQNGRPSFSLICALRLCLLPKNLRKTAGHLTYSGNQLSAENEVSAMQFLAKCCHTALQNLPTSAEDDYALLEAVEKVLNDSSLKDLVAIRSCSSEIEIFLKENNICNSGAIISVLPLKARKSMERWRLALQWRLLYKTSIHNCVSHCKEVIDTFLTLKKIGIGISSESS